MHASRPSRRLRSFVLPTLVASMAVGAALLPGSAWAKGGSKPVSCQILSATNNSEWQFSGCSQPANLTGGSGTIASLSLTPLPSSGTIVWGQTSNRNAAPLTTTFSMTLRQYTGKKDKCGGSLAEYRVTGAVTGNFANGSPVAVGVKGKIKWYVCLASNDNVTDLGGKRFGKAFVF